MIRNPTATGVVVAVLAAAILTTVIGGLVLLRPDTPAIQRGEEAAHWHSKARQVFLPRRAGTDVAAEPDKLPTASPGDVSTSSEPALDAGSNDSGRAISPPQSAEQARSDWYEECYAGTQMVRMAGRLINGRREGVWLEWYESGALESLTTYEGGELAGRAFKWFESGVTSWQGSFSKWGKEGRWTWYQPDGSLKLSGDYAFGFRAGNWSRYAEGGRPVWFGSYVIHHSAAQLVESLNRSDDGCFDNEEGEQGVRCGIWTFFDSAASVRETRSYQP